MTNRTAWTSLSRVDTGHVFAVGNPDTSSRWGWIQECVAEEFELHPDDVGCFEDDEMNDFAAHEGRPLVQIHLGYRRNAAPVVFAQQAAE